MMDVLQSYSLLHYFNQPQTKRRLSMLTRSDSKRGVWKYLGVCIPIVFASLLFACVPEKSDLIGLQPLPLEWDFKMRKGDGYQLYKPWTPQDAVNFNPDGSMRTMDEIRAVIAAEKGYETEEIRLISPETHDYYFSLPKIDKVHTITHDYYDLIWGDYKNGEPISKEKLLKQNYKQLIVKNSEKEELKIIGGRGIIAYPKDTVGKNLGLPVLSGEKYRLYPLDLAEDGYLSEGFCNWVRHAKPGAFVYISGVAIEQKGRKFVMPGRYKFVFE